MRVRARVRVRAHSVYLARGPWTVAYEPSRLLRCAPSTPAGYQGWDTDHTDVDLHVKEPTGEEVYYSHSSSETTGAHVSRDFTDGYGPEVYTLPRAPKGQYAIDAKYYASHQDSTGTGSTSAIIWSVKKLGRFDEEVVQFSSVRLTKHKQRQQVLAIDV